MRRLCQLNWDQIHEAPEGHGIYAWYCHLVLTAYDVEETIKLMHSAKSTNDHDSAVKHASDLLSKRLFSLVRQDDYLASVHGPLMPSFSGVLRNSQEISSSLLDRLV